MHLQPTGKRTLRKHVTSSPTFWAKKHTSTYRTQDGRCTLLSQAHIFFSSDSTVEQAGLHVVLHTVLNITLFPSLPIR